jgi:SNF2 family DNA or RNA helicase
MLLEPVMWSASIQQVKQMLSNLLDRIALFDRTPSSKEYAIVRYVQQVPSDDRVIIFSDYTGVLMGLERALHRQGIQCVVMTGLTDSKTNSGRLRRFQTQRDIKVLLMTLKLGYMGLNLMRDANHIVHVDPWWNPWVTEQADYRIIRPGQLKHIYINYFIMDDTIEVAIMNHTIRKKSLLKALMVAGGGGGAANADEGARLSGEDETLLFDYQVDIASLEQ